MERVLAAFKLNPYDVLEVPLEADEKEINKIYRKKSLLLHPDKVKDRECPDWKGNGAEGRTKEAAVSTLLEA